jgi:hypothetical protein
MTPDTYKVIQMAVDDGIAIGVRRAFKYEKDPGEDRVIEVIRQEVMNQICEWFKFAENNDG